jgi:hypothetical protein
VLPIEEKGERSFSGRIVHHGCPLVGPEELALGRAAMRSSILVGDRNRALPRSLANAKPPPPPILLDGRSIDRSIWRFDLRRRRAGDSSAGTRRLLSHGWHASLGLPQVRPAGGGGLSSRRNAGRLADSPQATLRAPR